jgi:hypothetical protein
VRWARSTLAALPGRSWHARSVSKRWSAASGRNLPSANRTVVPRDLNGVLRVRMFDLGFVHAISRLRHDREFTPAFGSREKRSAVPFSGMVNTELGSALTEIEFVLRTARALVSTFPDKAANFVVNALGQTVDPRLRHLLEPALATLGRNEAIAARKWLDRACGYERGRSGSRADWML